METLGEWNSRGAEAGWRLAGVGRIVTSLHPDETNLEERCEQGVGQENRWAQQNVILSHCWRLEGFVEMVRGSALRIGLFYWLLLNNFTQSEAICGLSRACSRLVEFCSG